MVAISNQKQAERVIEQYVKRNTPRSGERKDEPPTLADLFKFTSEIVFKVAMDINIILVRGGEKITIEQVMSEIMGGAYRLFQGRMEEFTERGIQVVKVDGEEESAEVEVEVEVEAPEEGEDLDES